MNTTQLNIYGYHTFDELSETTHTKVKNWIAAKQAVARATIELSHATTSLENAQFDLGAFLCPDNPVDDEQFNIWFGTGLLAVRRKNRPGFSPVYEIGWRQQPDEKQKAEMGF